MDSQSSTTKLPLSREQQRIVDQTEGPVLVIAGPGSGKTKTLVDRIVALVKKGVAPEEIFVGTFTEKAAKELVTRCDPAIAPPAPDGPCRSWRR